MKGIYLDSTLHEFVPLYPEFLRREALLIMELLEHGWYCNMPGYNLQVMKDERYPWRREK